MKHGNFSSLASNYSDYRAGYSQSVLKTLTSLLGKEISSCDFADIGAGTGIWTRMMNNVGPASIVAVEPNDSMRTIGIRDSESTKINWIKGSGEITTLQNNSVDMVSMASSFHWVDFEKGCSEFHRILRDNGRFVAIWNPRLIEENPLLSEIEGHLLTLKPDLKRVSSGRSGLVETLTDKLYQSKLFTDVIYIEGRHTITIDVEHYIGAWKSVNDVQFQLGKDKFEEFLQYTKEKLSALSTVDVTYLTRAWSALKC
jgi:ubiquinone/menaquinone biosynthesis C-methylase UbiE